MRLGIYSSVCINVLIALAVFGILTLYMLLFARIAIQIAQTYVLDPETAETSIFTNKVLYIVLLSVIMLPIVIKKRLNEIALTTYVLPIGVICLVTLLSVKLY